MAEPRYTLDHIGLGVRDLAVSRAFYDRALAPLGIAVAREHESAVGYGVQGRPQFFIEVDDRYDVGPVHVAFHAADRERVDAFHAAALDAGGRDNGAPGLRDYHPDYYGAFVLDPDGNNVEAVCHTG